MLEIPKIKLNLKALEKPVWEEMQESTLSHTASTWELGEVSPSLSEISVVSPWTPIKVLKQQYEQ